MIIIILIIMGCNDSCANDCKPNKSDEHCKLDKACCVTSSTGANRVTGTSRLSEYVYIYNLDAQVVAIEADISFSSNGIIVRTIIHVPGTSTIQIGSAGDYAIWFYENEVEPNQFTLFQNGVPVSGSVYGSGAGTQINSNASILIQKLS